MARRSTLHRLRLATIPLAVLGALALVLVAEAGAGQTRTVISVLYPRAYQDLQSLKHDSDIAVRGTVVSTAPFSVPGSNIPTTEATIRVVQEIFNKPTVIAPSIGTNIGVVQTGGWVNGSLAQVEEDPLLTPGENVVLFLHQVGERTYNVEGGPWGRFEIGVDGRVTSRANAQGSPLGAAHPTTAEFIAEIQNV